MMVLMRMLIILVVYATITLSILRLKNTVRILIQYLIVKFIKEMQQLRLVNNVTPDFIRLVIQLVMHSMILIVVKDPE